MSLSRYSAELGKSTEKDDFVVDATNMGGPAAFLNHSHEPNLRIVPVSYNHAETRMFDLALFALKDLLAGEELTFDYLEGSEDEDIPSFPSSVRSSFSFDLSV
jgi:histone-lysine N-methyltransferase SUV39H